MKLSLNLNQTKNFKPISGFKWILFFSVFFMMINSAQGNSPQAISGKDSLIIIFKGPTLQKVESLNHDLNTTVASVGANETLIDYFQPRDKMGNEENTRWYPMNSVFAPNCSTFLQYTNGILNFGKYGNSNQFLKKNVKKGISE
jgi:hypothetical protein